MATDFANLIEGKYAPISSAIEYTVTGSNTTTVVVILDCFTATNVSASPAQFSCHLVPSGGSVGDVYLVIDEATIMPGETYLCPEMIGQTMPESSFLSVKASAADAITFRASGRIITT